MKKIMRRVSYARSLRAALMLFAMVLSWHSAEATDFDPKEFLKSVGCSKLPIPMGTCDFLSSENARNIMFTYHAVLLHGFCGQGNTDNVRQLIRDNPTLLPEVCNELVGIIDLRNTAAAATRETDRKVTQQPSRSQSQSANIPQQVKPATPPTPTGADYYSTYASRDMEKSGRVAYDRCSKISTHFDQKNSALIVPGNGTDTFFETSVSGTDAANKAIYKCRQGHARCYVCFADGRDDPEQWLQAWDQVMINEGEQKQRQEESEEAASAFMSAFGAAVAGAMQAPTSGSSCRRQRDYDACVWQGANGHGGGSERFCRLQFC
jgi:hypothetical protein